MTIVISSVFAPKPMEANSSTNSDLNGFENSYPGLQLDHSLRAV